MNDDAPDNSVDRGEGATSAAETLPMFSAPPLDQLADALGDDDFAALAELVRLFVKDAQELVNSLQASLAAGLGRDTMRAAHTLKSSSAMLAAQRLSELCRVLEYAIRDQDATLDYAAQVEAIAAENARVRSALLSLIGEDQAAARSSDG